MTADTHHMKIMGTFSSINYATSPQQVKRRRQAALAAAFTISVMATAALVAGPLPDSGLLPWGNPTQDVPGALDAAPTVVDVPSMSVPSMSVPSVSVPGPDADLASGPTSVPSAGEGTGTDSPTGNALGGDDDQPGGTNPSNPDSPTDPATPTDPDGTTDPNTPGTPGDPNTPGDNGGDGDDNDPATPNSPGPISAAADPLLGSVIDTVNGATGGAAAGATGPAGDAGDEATDAIDTLIAPIAAALPGPSANPTTSPSPSPVLPIRLP